MIDDHDIADVEYTAEITQRLHGPDNTAIANHTISFGNQCNEYVDVIQQALDLALGNTGNLAPDSAVVDALDELYVTAHRARASDLLQLLVPLNKVLRSAEQAGFTLSQADTLLVQEAIIAITLAIDSIVNHKPAPALLSDVTQRMVDVAAENKHEIRANSEATGLVNIFVADADELLQRLFEQIQRWRASAGNSRSYAEVSRLLTSLQHSADSAGLTSISAVVQLLIERMLALRVAEVIPDTEFFDIAIETIETLGEDLDRIRNNEQLIEHSSLYERLVVEGVHVTATVGLRAGEQTEFDQSEAQRESTDYTDQIQLATQQIEHPTSEYSETPVSDVARLDSIVENQWPDRRVLVDMLKEISRYGDSIVERVEQLRRTIHLYPDTKQIAPDHNAEQSVSSVSPIDTIFFKIDSLLTGQRKSVTNMASALGVAEQRTLEAFGAELEKHITASKLTVEYLHGAKKVVVDSQLYEHLGYVLRIMFDSVSSTVQTKLLGINDVQKNDPRSDTSGLTTDIAAGIVSKLVFDLIDDELSIKLVGPHIQLSKFVLANTSVRRVDEQMLKTPLPRWSGDGAGKADSANIKMGAVAKVIGKEVRVGQHNDLVTLASFQRLIDVAVFFQGRVAATVIDQAKSDRVTSHDANGDITAAGEIEIIVPVAAVSEELILIRDGQQIYGIQTSAVNKIEGTVTSRDAGYESKGTTNPQQGAVFIHCKCSNGANRIIRADSIVGRQTASVTKNPQLMLGSSYLGAFVFGDSSLVLVINPDEGEQPIG